MNLLRLFKRRREPAKDIVLVHELNLGTSEFSRLDLAAAVKRVAKSNKSDLIFDPVGYYEFQWLAGKGDGKTPTLRDVFETSYKLNSQTVLDMPKRGYTFRPVSYLLPADSIIYQALVDKIMKDHRRNFSKHVYSNIVNEVSRANVFDNPVGHWLRMRENIRVQNRKGCRYYFFSDISGYFENIKIGVLLDALKFYVRQKDERYLSSLHRVLERWHYAKAQGIIQPHHASSILAKVYLCRVDSHFAYLRNKYNRYVDEFHILSETKPALLKSALELASVLRELGLNQNAAKSEFLQDGEVMARFSRDQDFFNRVNYLERVQLDYEEAKDQVKKRYSQFMTDAFEGKDPNPKVFRYCIRRFTREKDPVAVDDCLRLIPHDPDSIVDIVRYLSVFKGDLTIVEKVVAYIENYLRSDELNYSSWAEAWLLGLLLDMSETGQINLEIVRGIAFDENKNEVSRSVCFMILGRILEAQDLMMICDLYQSENSTLLKRAMLTCISRLPVTVSSRYLQVTDDDDMNIKVLKMYLQERPYDVDSKVN